MNSEQYRQLITNINTTNKMEFPNSREKESAVAAITSESEAERKKRLLKAFCVARTGVLLWYRRLCSC